MKPDAWFALHAITASDMKTHCKHCNYQNRHLWAPFMACVARPTISSVFEEIQSFLPSASLPSLDLIIIVIHCDHVQAHRLEKVCMLISAEKLGFLLIL